MILDNVANKTTTHSEDKITKNIIENQILKTIYLN